tara:strand:- start:1000 stop:1992 length:993 start_codon:yes stop_codon:yes gene_type:complete
MIIKNYEIKNFISTANIFLFYGENVGQKEEVLDNFFKKNFVNSTYVYDEKTIKSNLENFYNQITTNSFFENKKLIIINNITEKIKEEIEIIIEKKIQDLTLVLTTGILEKKSKLRIFFEKNKNLIIIPFYKDNSQSLAEIAKSFFKQKSILSSQETINLIVEKSSGDRKNLKNELIKIENFLGERKKLSFEDTLKIVNLSENYNMTELVNYCLAKDKKNTLKIINENIFSFEDCIIITRLLLSASKRLMNLIEKISTNNNIEYIISSYRPPIFWKDKEIIKTQIKNWTSKNIKELIIKTNEIELAVKKNSNNALNIVFNFLIEQSSKTNN